MKGVKSHKDVQLVADIQPAPDGFLVKFKDDHEMHVQHDCSWFNTEDTSGDLSTAAYPTPKKRRFLNRSYLGGLALLPLTIPMVVTVAVYSTVMDALKGSK